MMLSLSLLEVLVSLMMVRNSETTAVPAAEEEVEEEDWDEAVVSQ